MYKNATQDAYSCHFTITVSVFRFTKCPYQLNKSQIHEKKR